MNEIYTPIPETQKDKEKDIEELLFRASKFDDKPHQLFSWIRQLAVKYGSADQRESIKETMDLAYRAVSNSRLILEMDKLKTPNGIFKENIKMNESQIDFNEETTEDLADAKTMAGFDIEFTFPEDEAFLEEMREKTEFDWNEAANQQMEQDWFRD